MNQEDLMKKFSPPLTPEATGEVYLQKPKYMPTNPQDTLDLHGKTVSEALFDLEGFLKESEIKGLTKVQVITGRGQNSPGGVPVLFIEVKKYLEKYEYSYKKGVGNFDVFFCAFS